MQEVNMCISASYYIRLLNCTFVIYFYTFIYVVHTTYMHKHIGTELKVIL